MPTLDAFGLIVTDMARALDFYRRLGLTFPAGAESEGHVEADLGGGMRLLLDTVAVVQSFTTWEPATGGHRMGLAFRCDSPAEVDATYEAVVAAGYTGKTPPWDAFWGQRYAQLVDPDGNPVDLYAALAG